MSVLQPGDVNDYGDIQSTEPGTLYAYGMVVVTPEQAQRAAKFGWTVVLARKSKVVVQRDKPFPS